MVTHGGRCPLCENRTTPGVGARAGFWICMPCKTVFDNYGQVYQSPIERATHDAPKIVSTPFEPALAPSLDAARRYQIVPRARHRRDA